MALSNKSDPKQLQALRERVRKQKQDKNNVTTTIAPTNTGKAESRTSYSSAPKTSNKSDPTQLQMLRERVARKKQESNIGFDTINDDINSLNTTIDNVYKGWHDRDVMGTTKTDIENMVNRLTAYEDYRNKYGNDEYTDASELLTSYKTVLDEWDNLSDSYAGYNDAEEYLNGRFNTFYIEQLLEEAKSKTTDEYYEKRFAEESERLARETPHVPIGAHADIIVTEEMRTAQRAVEEYEAELAELRELNGLNSYTTEVTAKDDFEQYSKYSPTKSKSDEELKAEGYKQDANGDWYKTIGLGGRDSYVGEDSDIYTYINDPSKRLALDAETIQSGGFSLYLDNGYDKLTEFEKGAYNYLYYWDKVNGTNTADEYLDNIAPLLSARAMRADEEATKKDAKEAPVIMSGVSLGYNFMNGLMLPPKLAATAMGVYDDVPMLDLYGNRSEAIRGAVSEDMSYIGRIAYNAGMSMGDMGVAFLAGGGDKILTQVIMSSSAGSSALSTAKENGASDLKAFITGIGSAAIEAATEKWSIDAILSNPKGTLGYIVKNIVTEGAEEGASNIANTIFDSVVSGVLGERSEIDQRIGELVLDGKTETEALLIVFGEKVQSLGEDVLTGAFSGGGMSAITSTPSVVAKGVNKITNKPTQEINAPTNAIGIEAQITEQDTLEKAAIDVVNARNATQNTENEAVSNNSKQDENLPTRQETVSKMENVPSNNSIDEEQRSISSGIESIEAKATEAAFEAGRKNVPREKVTLVTPAQEEAYNAGRLEHIKNMPNERSKVTNIDGKQNQTYNVSGKMTDKTRNVLDKESLHKVVGTIDGRAYISDGSIAIPIAESDVEYAKSEWGLEDNSNIAKTIEEIANNNEYVPISTNPVEVDLPGINGVYVFTTDDGRQIAIKKNYAQYFEGYDFSAAFVKGKPYAIKVTDSDGNVAGVVMAIVQDSNGEYNLTDTKEVSMENFKNQQADEESVKYVERTQTEANGSGKRKGVERVRGKIKEILRKSYVERSDNGVNGRGRGTETGTESGRVEQTETSEEFEERMLNNGYKYANLGRVSVGYKYAQKSEWSQEAKIAAENIRGLGLTVVVFEGELHANYNGVSESLTAAVTAGSGDYLTIFISSDLDIDGMETAYHEAFHALRKSKSDKLITQRQKMVDIISDGVNVENGDFEKFVSVIEKLYSYEVRSVNIDYFSEEVTEEFYAWYIGIINATQNEHNGDMLAYIEEFSDVDNIKSQIEALFAEIKSDASNSSKNESVNDVHTGVLDGENKKNAQQSSTEHEAERYDIPEGSEIVNNIVVDEYSKRLKRENPRAYSNIVRMAKRLGMTVRFVKDLTDENGKVLEGLITSKGIFINADAKNPSRFVATHEFGHRMKQAAPEVWAAYQEYVINKLKKESFGNGRTAYDVLYEETKNAYGKDDAAYINEEIAVNYAGELFDSEEMLESFIREDKRLALRVRDWWYNVLESMGLLSEKKKAQQLWLRAYTAAAKNVKEGKVGEYDEVKCDIVTLDNGKTYIEATRQVLTGTNISEWRKSITKFFNKALKNGDIKITATDGSTLTITKDTAKKARDNYKRKNGQIVKMSDDEFLVKLHAESHIDELAEISKKVGHSSDGKSHPFATDGFDYKVVYFKDFDNSYYKITLSVGLSNGVSTVYNVGKIKTDNLPTGKIISRKVGQSPMANLSVDATVSQDNPSVNSHSMQNTSKNIQGETQSEETDEQRRKKGFQKNSLIKKIQSNLEQLSKEDVILSLNTDIFNDRNMNIVEQVGNFFNSLGNEVYRAGFGEVILDKDGIKSAIGHKLGRAKCIAFRAVPDIIKYGKQIDYQEKWKGRPYDSYVFAGKVKIGKEDAFVGVVVTRNKNTSEYYLHEIVDNEGNFISIKNDEVVPNKTVSKTDNSLHGGTTSPIDTISQDDHSGNSHSMKNTEENAQEGKKSIAGTRLSELVEKYGTIPSGEKPHRNVQVPRKTSQDKKVSQTVRTILEAKATPDEAVPTIEKLVEDGTFSYDVYTDKEAIANGEDHIKEHGWEESLLDWFDAVNSGEVSKDITTKGWILYNHAANSKDTKNAIMILDAMVRHQRSAAQALQATRILKNLSPETQLYGVQKSVEAFKKELIERYGKKAPDLKIDTDLAEQFLNAKTEEERTAAEIEIYRDIGRQMPSNWIDKWNAWRYIAMLTNPRTHVRNMLGNAFFAPVVATKNLTATAIEAMVKPLVSLSGKKMSRGKALVWGSKTDRALLKAAFNDYSNVADIISNGGKYNDSAMGNKYIQEGRRIFKGILMPVEWLRRGNSYLLEWEDMVFSKPHYAYALAQYCKAHNITPEQIQRGKAIAPAREYAIKEAQKATYRDTNAFSQMVSDLGRSGKRNWATNLKRTLAEGVLPFRKTPANILARGVEYSPIGIIKGVAELFKVGKEVDGRVITASDAIDSLSAGLTGSGLLALGAYLAAQGVVRDNGGEEEEEEKEFYELMGHQNYSLELPSGESVTLDWLAPESLPFFTGVAAWEIFKGNKENVNLATLIVSLLGMSDPMLEMSFLQGINDVLESIGYAKSNGMKAVPTIIASAVTSYLTQGIPTLFGQIERTGEEERMTTYTEKDSFFTNDMQYTFGKMSAKIPFWDYNQIPYIDAWGRKEASGSALKRGLNNFLNPAYTSTIETSKMEKELLRLYEQTGDDGVFPERADKYFTVDGVRKDLTADEYVRYATLKGEKSYKLVSDLVKSKTYKKLSDKEKADAVMEAYDYADQKAKQAISNYKPDTWINKADDFGTDVGNYISFRTEVGSTKENNDDKISKSEVVDIILDVAQNDSETWKMYLSMYDSQGDMYAYNKGIRGEDYMDFLVALDKYDRPTESGKYGTYTQEEAEFALDSMSIPREQKAILWQSVNTTWKAKNNPYR